MTALFLSTQHSLAVSQGWQSPIKTNRDGRRLTNTEQVNGGPGTNRNRPRLHCQTALRWCQGPEPPKQTLAERLLWYRCSFLLTFPCLCHWSVSTYVPGTRLHFPNAPNKLKKRYTPHFTAWETKAQSHKISTQGDQCMGRGLRFNSFNNSCDKAHKPKPINQSPHLTHEPARWLYNYTQSQALLVGVCYKAFFCPFNLLT